MRPIPAVVLTLIHRFEQGPHGGFAATRYLDPVGRPTIGYGHRLLGPTDPLWDATLDQDSADNLAMSDLSEAATIICDSLGSAINDLNDNQYAATIDFTFNEGGGNFATSTFAKLIEADDLADAAEQLPKWVYAGGNVEPGLVNRREAEVDLWNEPVAAP